MSRSTLSWYLRIHHIFVGPLMAVMLASLLASCQSMGGGGEADPLAGFDAAVAPEAVGARLVENLLARKEFAEGGVDGTLYYCEAGAYYGAIEYGMLTGNTELLGRAIDRMNWVIQTVPGRKWMPSAFHVDAYVYGIVPLELYLADGSKTDLAIGLDYADRQWEDPGEQGLTRQARFWVDDAFMVGMLQIQAYRATQKPVYAQQLMRFLTAYIERLQAPGGLFRHNLESPFFWGRGNGWIAVAMAEALDALPPDTPGYGDLMQAYRRQMAALLKTQDADGMWHQLVDAPDAWAETSGSAMFTFAMVTGVNHRWLGPEYAEAARKGWIALCGYLEPDGDLREVCVGTGATNNRNFYLTRPRATGDLHGQAPMIWAADALLRHAKDGE